MWNLTLILWIPVVSQQTSRGKGWWPAIEMGSQGSGRWSDLSGSPRVSVIWTQPPGLTELQGCHGSPGLEARCTPRTWGWMRVECRMRQRPKHHMSRQFLWEGRGWCLEDRGFLGTEWGLCHAVRKGLGTEILGRSTGRILQKDEGLNILLNIPDSAKVVAFKPEHPGLWSIKVRTLVPREGGQFHRAEIRAPFCLSREPGALGG